MRWIGLRPAKARRCRAARTTVTWPNPQRIVVRAVRARAPAARARQRGERHPVIGRHRVQRADRRRGEDERPGDAIHARTASWTCRCPPAREPGHPAVDAEAFLRRQRMTCGIGHDLRDRVADGVDVHLGRCGRRSSLVSSTRSAFANMVGYLSGLSSPSVTERATTLTLARGRRRRGRRGCRRSR